MTSSDPIEDYGMCWRTAYCTLPATHSGVCRGKVHQPQCGYHDPVLLDVRCDLTEGHEAVHQYRAGTNKWEVIGPQRGTNPSSLKALTQKRD